MIKKIIAPVIIGLIIIGYFILWGVGLIQVATATTQGVILGLIIPLGSIGVMIYVTIQRIREIRSGEEDDLSEY